jgi:hypothetical protein
VERRRWSDDGWSDDGWSDDVGDSWSNIKIAYGQLFI